MTNKLKDITKSEVFTGVLLIIATIVSLIIANSRFGQAYNNFFTYPIIGEFNVHLIINDFLMAIFFLFVGLEIKHEILYGRLSSFKKASFPIIAAIGGVLLPAIIFTIINLGTPFSDGIPGEQKNEMDQIYSAGYVFLLYDKTKRMIEKWDVSKKLQ